MPDQEERVVRTHVTMDLVDTDRERSLDAAIGRVLEEFASVASIHVVIHPAINGPDAIAETRRYDRCKVGPPPSPAARQGSE